MVALLKGPQSGRYLINLFLVLSEFCTELLQVVFLHAYKALNRWSITADYLQVAVQEREIAS
jgi:hypothetical protein